MPVLGFLRDVVLIVVGLFLAALAPWLMLAYLLYLAGGWFYRQLVKE